MIYGKEVGGTKKSPGPEDETKSLGPIYPAPLERLPPKVTHPVPTRPSSPVSRPLRHYPGHVPPASHPWRHDKFSPSLLRRPSPAHLDSSESFFDESDFVRILSREAPTS